MKRQLKLIGLAHSFYRFQKFVLFEIEFFRKTNGAIGYKSVSFSRFSEWYLIKKCSFSPKCLKHKKSTLNVVFWAQNAFLCKWPKHFENSYLFRSMQKLPSPGPRFLSKASPPSHVRQTVCFYGTSPTLNPYEKFPGDASLDQPLVTPENEKDVWHESSVG